MGAAPSQFLPDHKTERVSQHIREINYKNQHILQDVSSEEAGHIFSAH